MHKQSVPGLFLPPLKEPAQEVFKQRSLMWHYLLEWVIALSMFQVTFFKHYLFESMQSTQGCCIYTYLLNKSSKGIQCSLLLVTLKIEGVVSL